MQTEALQLRDENAKLKTQLKEAQKAERTSRDLRS